MDAGLNKKKKNTNIDTYKISRNTAIIDFSSTMTKEKKSILCRIHVCIIIYNIVLQRSWYIINAFFFSVICIRIYLCLFIEISS